MTYIEMIQMSDSHAYAAAVDLSLDEDGVIDGVQRATAQALLAQYWLDRAQTLPVVDYQAVLAESMKDDDDEIDAVVDPGFGPRVLEAAISEFRGRRAATPYEVAVLDEVRKSFQRIWDEALRDGTPG